MCEVVRQRHEGHEIELRQSPNPACPTCSIWSWSVFAEQATDGNAGDATRQLLGTGEQTFNTRARAVLDAIRFVSNLVPSEFTPARHPKCERCGQDSTDGATHGARGSLCGPCLLEVEWVRIGLSVMPNETWCPHCHRVRTRYEQRGAVRGWFPRACGGRLGCVELRGKMQAAESVRLPETTRD